MTMKSSLELSTINEKLLTSIFEQLPSLELFRIKSVCKKFNTTATMVLNQRTHFDLRSTFGDETKMPTDANQCVKILRRLFKRCPKLAYIDLGSFAIHFNANLQPRWEMDEMKVGNFPITDEDLRYIAECCPLVKTLKLSWMFDTVTDEGIRSIITNCLHLERLDLDDCWNVSGRYFHMLTSNIRRINCLESPSIDLLVRQIAKGPGRSSLEVLLLGMTDGGASEANFGPFQTNVDGVHVLQELCGACYKLRYLCWDLRIRVESATQVIAALYHLETLDLRSDSLALNDAAIVRIMRCCPKLKRLAVECYNERAELYGIGDEALRFLPKYLPDIEAFSTRNLVKLTDYGLTKIILECKKLQLLRVEGSLKLSVNDETKAALQQSAQMYPKRLLRYLIEYVGDASNGYDNLIAIADSEDFDELFFEGVN